MDRDWQKTFILMKDQKDPVAARLLAWIYATETNIPMEAKDLMAFVRDNPGWPRLSDFRDKIEESIAASGVRPHETAEWFRQNPPRGHDGIRAFMTALSALGHAAEAEHAIRAFWRKAELNKNETAALAAQYRTLLPATEHAARLDALIWGDRHAEAEYMLAFVGPETRALGQARIALARRDKRAPKLVEAVPARLKGDQGLLFERVRWYRRKDESAKALSLLNSITEPFKHPELWWVEQNTLARRAIEEHDYAKAYSIIKKHQLPAGVERAQAQWLLHWLELRFLNAPDAAYAGFASLYTEVQSAISKSRAAYWAARAAEALRLPEQAREWDSTSAIYLSTYYGQLSRAKINALPPTPEDPPPAPEEKAAFEARDLVHAVRVLDRIGLNRFIDPFLARLIADAKTRTDFQLAARLARDVGRDYYAVQANKDIQQRLGGYLLADGYPVLRSVAGDTPEKALVHAIIYRESMFDTSAVSSAGARGLMQLMPATAKAVSKGKKKKYTKDKLTGDPRYNILIGSAYLASLVDDYGGNYPFAIAAYNAGPGNLSDWTRLFGNPARGGIDVVDWVELIPNHETRNYVQRVMESYYMYRLKFGQKPLTVRDFIPAPGPRH